MAPRSHPATAGLRASSTIRREMKRRGFAEFEAIDRVARQQASQIRRNADQASAMWEAMARCHEGDQCRSPKRCQAACLFGQWRYRADLVIKAHDRLVQADGQALLVTAVHWKWGYLPGDLNSLKPRTLHRWLQRRLADLPGLRGIASADVSLNMHDGEIWWQGHLHAVIAGGDAAEIRAALAVPPTAAVPKPIMVKPIGAGDLARTLAYVTKPLPEGRVAYTAENGRQRQRYVNVPLRHLREHDHWRMGMRMPERFMILGTRLGRIGTSECR